MGDLGSFVRARRKELDLTLDVVARETGISYQALSLIELGRSRDLKAVTARRLARALQVDLEVLLDLLEPIPA